MLRVILPFLAVLLSACSGNSNAPVAANSPPPPLPSLDSPVVTVEVELKHLIFSWVEVSGATHYRLLANPDGHSGFTQLGEDIPAGISSMRVALAVHLHDFTNALYMVEACNSSGCNGSTHVNSMNGVLAAIGFFKASNTASDAVFGHSVALSADGNTVAVGAPDEDSNATGIDGNQNDDSAISSGAVYLFRFNGTAWSQQAYIKASNSGGGDQFGWTLALSDDGNTLAVGARFEDSGATGINGNQDDNSSGAAGAVYLFRFDGTAWSQQSYFKASNTERQDQFGYHLALSADGNTLAVAAKNEDSVAVGIGGDQHDNSAEKAGAVYLFRFDGNAWSQQAYVKASNSELDDQFGFYVALSEDGNTLAVGARHEDSIATGVGGDQDDNSAENAGAVYVFRFDGMIWSQQAFIKASNTGADDHFGWAVALSGNGDTLAVASRVESSNATGINGNELDNSSSTAGAVYVYRFDGLAWSQQAYVKASNTEGFDVFGDDIALSGDGNILAVGSPEEDSIATGINGDQHDNSSEMSGAVYIFRFDGTAWSQHSYVKASNTDAIDVFGHAIALSKDGNTLAVGAPGESSDATGINGKQNDNSSLGAGAIYLY